MAEALETEVRVKGADDFVRELSECYNAILKTGEVTKQTAQRIREARAPMLAMSRTISGVRMAYRMQHAEMLESMRLLRKVGSIGYSVVHMWNAYSVAQLRVESTQRSLAEAQSRVAIIQNELNNLQRQGITTGEKYLNLQLELNQAKAHAEERSKALAKAQQENIIGYVGMGLQIVGLIPRMQELYQIYATIKAIHVGTTAAIWAETVARSAAAAAAWFQAKAEIVLHALAGPIGWALLATAAGVSALYIAKMVTEQQRSMQMGGFIPETGWYYMHRHEEVTPAYAPRRGNIYFYIYETRRARDTAKEVIDVLRRRGEI